MSALRAQRIESPHDPRIEIYRNQKDAWLKAQQGLDPADRKAGLFMAEGELVVRTLLASGLKIHSLLLSETRLAAMADALAGLAPSVPVFVASREVLEAIIGFDLHRGILAAGVRPCHPPLQDLLATRSTVLVLEDLANHDNMGSLFRSLAALGGIDRSAVLLSPRCCDPLYRKALRVSMGAALRIPWAVVDPWPSGLHSLREARFEILAMTPESRAQDVRSLRDLPTGTRRKLALLLGAEGPGLSTEAMVWADRRIRISIDPAIDSLNVGVAGAIALAILDEEFPSWEPDTHSERPKSSGG